MRSRHGAEQLALGAELGRDDRVDVVVLDHFNRVLDVIPAHLGERLESRDRASLHGATLWAFLAIRDAERRLPPPTWTTFPCHDHDPPALGTQASPSG